MENPGCDNFSQIRKTKESNVSSSLRFVSELPPTYHSVFSEFKVFNSIQSHLLDDILLDDASIIVSAPTGSGKTTLFELAIVRLLEMSQAHGASELSHKIVYMAPVKALCTERYNDWETKFQQLGLKAIEVTGDSDEGNLLAIQHFNLVLTTPEKWDSITRKWRDHASLVSVIKLFLIDEVHLLSEDKRGSTLEAVVSRMKTVQESSSCSSFIRFIAVSATIPNIEDVASWLGKKSKPAKYFRFGEETRPVKLRKIVKSFPFGQGMTYFKFDLNLSYKLKEIILDYSEGKPALIFCSTRKSVIQTSSILLQNITFHFNQEQKMSLENTRQVIQDPKLKDMIRHGVGFHHGGLLASDRHNVEDLFRSGFLPVLVCTSTLAMGVNLPAHLVVIKSTAFYVNDSWEEYSEGQVLQMMGRAGRPQYDSQATAVILTKSSQKERYERLLQGNQLVESNLHKNLAEHLNSEIVLGTITDIAVAVHWLRSTFFYVRALKNPRHYGIPCGLSLPEVEARLQGICMRELNGLEKYDLIKKTDFAYNVEPTQNGKLMARLYLTLGTMKIFMKVKGTETLPELLDLLCSCHEFIDVKLRGNERATLNLLNSDKQKEAIRFQLPGRIKSREMKVNCLLQAVLGLLHITDPSLSQEANRVVRLAERVAKALSLYLWQKNCYQALASALTLAKCFSVRMWENSIYLSRHLPGIGTANASLLAAAKKVTFRAIIESNPRDLERILNKHPPIGYNLQEAAKSIPEYCISLSYSEYLRKVQITVKLVNAISVHDPSRTSSLLVGDTNNMLLHKEKIRDGTLIANNGEYIVSLRIPKGVRCILITLISDAIVGADIRKKYALSTKECVELLSGPSVSCQEEFPAQNIIKETKKKSDIQTQNKTNKKLKTQPEKLQTNLHQFAFKPVRHKILQHSQKIDLSEAEVSSTQDNVFETCTTSYGNKISKIDPNGLKTAANNNQNISHGKRGSSSGSNTMNSSKESSSFMKSNESQYYSGNEDPTHKKSRPSSSYEHLRHGRLINDLNLMRHQQATENTSNCNPLLTSRQNELLLDASYPCTYPSNRSMQENAYSKIEVRTQENKLTYNPLICNTSVQGNTNFKNEVGTQESELTYNPNLCNMSIKRDPFSSKAAIAQENKASFITKVNEKCDPSQPQIKQVDVKKSSNESPSYWPTRNILNTFVRKPLQASPEKILCSNQQSRSFAATEKRKLFPLFFPLDIKKDQDKSNTNSETKNELTTINELPQDKSSSAMKLFSEKLPQNEKSQAILVEGLTTSEEIPNHVKNVEDSELIPEQERPAKREVSDITLDSKKVTFSSQISVVTPSYTPLQKLNENQGSNIQEKVNHKDSKTNEETKQGKTNRSQDGGESKSLDTSYDSWLDDEESDESIVESEGVKLSKKGVVGVFEKPEKNEESVFQVDDLFPESPETKETIRSAKNRPSTKDDKRNETHTRYRHQILKENNTGYQQQIFNCSKETELNCDVNRKQLHDSTQTISSENSRRESHSGPFYIKNQKNHTGVYVNVPITVCLSEQNILGNTYVDSPLAPKLLRNEYGDPFAPIHQSAIRDKPEANYKPSFHKLNKSQNYYLQSEYFQGASNEKLPILHAQSNDSFQEAKPTHSMKNPPQTNLTDQSSFLYRSNNSNQQKQNKCGEFNSSLTDFYPILKSTTFDRNQLPQSSYNKQVSRKSGFSEPNSNFICNTRISEKRSIFTRERNEGIQPFRVLQNSSNKEIESYKRSMMQNNIFTPKSKVSRKVKTDELRPMFPSLSSLVFQGGRNKFEQNESFTTFQPANPSQATAFRPLSQRIIPQTQQQSSVYGVHQSSYTPVFQKLFNTPRSGLNHQQFISQSQNTFNGLSRPIDLNEGAISNFNYNSELNNPQFFKGANIFKPIPLLNEGNVTPSFDSYNDDYDSDELANQELSNYSCAPYETHHLSSSSSLSGEYLEGAWRHQGAENYLEENNPFDSPFFE